MARQSRPSWQTDSNFSVHLWTGAPTNNERVGIRCGDEFNIVLFSTCSRHLPSMVSCTHHTYEYENDGMVCNQHLKQPAEHRFPHTRTRYVLHYCSGRVRDQNATLWQCVRKSARTLNGRAIKLQFVVCGSNNASIR